MLGDRADAHRPRLDESRGRRWLTLRRRAAVSKQHADDGQAVPEYIGTLGIVAMVMIAVMIAFSMNLPGISSRATEVICQILTFGQGDCGGGETIESRQPLDPCPVRAHGDQVSAGIKVAVVDVGTSRGFTWEELSDGTFKVSRNQDASVGTGAGVGAKGTFVVLDREFARDDGAAAWVSGTFKFTAGSEWEVDSAGARDQLMSAERWERFDQAASILPGWQDATLMRRRLGIGEHFPPPARVYREGGLQVNGRAGLGVKNLGASAGGGSAVILGHSEELDGSGEKTFYVETKVEGDAKAGALGIAGAEARGETTILTSITVDGDGQITAVERSGVAAGKGAELTGFIFGDTSVPFANDSAITGTEYTARLDVKTPEDRALAEKFVASAKINPLAVGVTPDPDAWTSGLDRVGTDFMDAVRQRGELTRHQISTDDYTWLDAGVDIGAGGRLGMSGSYSQNELTTSNHEYWDGTAFAPRTNC